jgi:hypothetical protein
MSWAVETLSVKTQRVGDVLVARIAGFLSFDSSREMGVRLAPELALSSPRALVLDLRLVTHVMDEAQWVRTAEHAAKKNSIHLPVASIVQEAELVPTGRHCMRMANYGFMRAVFTREEEALRWARHWGSYWSPLALQLARRDAAQASAGRNPTS